MPVQTYSEVKITFKQDLVVGSSLSLGMQYQALPEETFLETWKTVRTGLYEVTTGTPTATVGERAAINFVASFNLDYFDANLTVVRNGAVVIIKTPVLGQVFQNGECIITQPNTPANVTFEYTNVLDNKTNIDDIEFLEASTLPCQNVLVSVQTSEVALNILSPFVLLGNTDNPIEFETVRGQDIVFTIENADSVQNTVNVSVPKVLLSANFTINTNSTPSGSNISITNVNSQGLVLEYSLDNINYQSENTYTNLASGDYTLYVKDQLGCSFSKQFTVDEFGVNNPIFYVSKSNPIRYAQRVDFGDAINYKTDENTLSCETDAEVPTMEVQRFQSADIVPTQFRSNYTTNIAKVIKEDATEDIIPIIKRSTFIGNKDKRDALKCLVSVGKIGIYFTQGNLYNYTTNAVTGTYALNGYLPYWAKVGGYIILDGVWHLIENIVFNEILNAEVIVISGTYIGASTPVVVGSIFNFEDFEVYEFFVDMVNYIDQNIRVKITASKSGFPDIEYLSELINVQVLQIGTYEILYWNDTNTDVYYSTGIKSKLRQQVEKVDLIDKQEQEVNYTDTTIDLLSANIYDGNEFEFSPISKEMVVKLKRALTHENLYINGVGYKKADSIDSEVLGNTNFYTVKAKLFKDGNVYNSLISGSSEIYNGANLEVPGFVDYGGGFMKY